MASTSSPFASKRKHNVLTVEEKLEIYSKLDKGETVIFLTRFYNVSKTTMNNMKNREGLVSFHYKKSLKVHAPCFKRICMMLLSKYI